VAVAVLAGSGEDVGAAVMEVKKVEKKSAESRSRFLIDEISPSMGKKLVEKILLRKIGS
jgi:hypothetical protein